MRTTKTRERPASTAIELSTAGGSKNAQRWCWCFYSSFLSLWTGSLLSNLVGFGFLCSEGLDPYSTLTLPNSSSCILLVLFDCYVLGRGFPFGRFTGSGRKGPRHPTLLLVCLTLKGLGWCEVAQRATSPSQTLPKGSASPNPLFWSLVSFGFSFVLFVSFLAACLGCIRWVPKRTNFLALRGLGCLVHLFVVLILLAFHYFLLRLCDPVAFRGCACFGLLVLVGVFVLDYLGCFGFCLLLSVLFWAWSLASLHWWQVESSFRFLSLLPPCFSLVFVHRMWFGMSNNNQFLSKHQNCIFQHQKQTALGRKWGWGRNGAWPRNATKSRFLGPKMGKKKEIGKGKGCQ